MPGKSKFNLFDMLNDASKADINKNSFNIEFIDIEKIIPSQNNFYSIADVGELKDSIRLDGLQQNLLIRKKAASDFYELISGERRYTAIKLLIQEGREDLRLIPCKVEYNIDDIRAELQLIFANSTNRIISDYEKMQQATKMKSLLQELKKSGVELSGRLRDIVADSLNISPTQVARLESINNNLAPEFQEELKNKNINVSTASELATLPEDEQREAYEEYQKKGGLKIKDVTQRKDKKSDPQPETNVMEGQTTITDKPVDKLDTEAEPNKVYKDTKCVDKCICVYCGHVFDGLKASNWNIQMRTVNCPVCRREMKVQVSIKFTCSAMEGGLRVC